jgi:outer membrane protein assembly factor BamA
MKRFALALVLLSISANGAAVAQSSIPKKSVTVRNLTLINLTQLPVADYEQIVQEIESGRYEGDSPTEFTNRIRYALQQRGYFRPEVGEVEITVVSETPAETVVDISVRVNPGPLYRLDSLVFSGYKAFLAEQLRAQFSISPGDIFDVEKVRESIENLRRFYADNGYTNFTPVPNTEVLDSRNRIRLTVTLDEGPRFYFGDLQFAHPLSAEAAQAVAADWASYKGKPYDATELVEFIKQHQMLPPGFQPEHNLLIRQDAKSHTVAIVVQP